MFTPLPRRTMTTRFTSRWFRILSSMIAGSLLQACEAGGNDKALRDPSVLASDQLVRSLFRAVRVGDTSIVTTVVDSQTLRTAQMDAVLARMKVVLDSQSSPPELFEAVMDSSGGLVPALKLSYQVPGTRPIARITVWLEKRNSQQVIETIDIGRAP